MSTSSSARRTVRRSSAPAEPGTIPPLDPGVSFREQVEKELAAKITSGQMPAGEVFSAPSLAVQFGVSATPVREAMLNLAKQGFVEIVRNKGFRVTDVSEDDLRAIVEVRQMLEVPAVGRLAGALDSSDCELQRELADDIVKAAEEGHLRRYLEADTRYHLMLIERLGNPRLVQLVSELRAQTRLTGLATLVGSEQLAISAHEHHDLLDLLAANDRPGAEALLHRHFQHVLGWWSGHGESAPSENEPTAHER